VCRAVKVLCVATDQDALVRLRRASVGAGWELVAGAIDLRGALDQLDIERPHALVVFGPFDDLVALAAERFPEMRIITDRETPGASVVAASMEDVRELLAEQPRPGGPVR
jgi:predicted lipid carrier protein YhbT